MKSISIPAILLLLCLGLASGQEISKVGEPVLIDNPEAPFLQHPTWSPEGDRLMVSTVNYQGIYILEFPTGELTTVCEDPAAGYGAAWSPDGSFIAARVARYEDRRRRNAIVVFDLENGSRRALMDYTTSLPGIPEWTSDQRFIYLNYSDRLRIYPLEDSVKAVPDTPILLALNDQLQRFQPDTKSTIRLLDGDLRILNLRPAPDASLYVLEEIGGPLYLFDTDSAQLQEIGIGYNPSWSPDGKYICFMISKDDGHQYTESDIFIRSVDGQFFLNLTNTTDRLEMNPSWSPDGNWIAYDAIDEGKIYVQEIRLP